MNNVDREINKIIGGKIKTLRIKRSWSLEQLGKHIGKSKKTVQRYETGEHRISYSALLRLSTILEFDFSSYLYCQLTKRRERNGIYN